MGKLLNEGALECARYAFAPNWYHYCGPDTKGELGEYINEETTDKGLVEKLAQFETLYPYLQAIAAANAIRDPLDKRVVEAYWVGNVLLESVTEQAVFKALTENQHLPKRLSKKEMRELLPKIDRRARLHHSFHVLNVFTRTGHHTVKQTVETMDQCRISWGKITDLRYKIQDLRITLQSQELRFWGGKLELVPVIREAIVAQEALAKRLSPGDYISVHWGIVCDKLSERAIKRLSYYTEQSIRLANETI